MLFFKNTLSICPSRQIVAPLERATFSKAKKTMLALSVRGF
jgi:hypothetical protein